MCTHTYIQNLNRSFTDQFPTLLPMIGSDIFYPILPILSYPFHSIRFYPIPSILSYPIPSHPFHCIPYYPVYIQNASHDSLNWFYDTLTPGRKYWIYSWKIKSVVVQLCEQWQWKKLFWTEQSGSHRYTDFCPALLLLKVRRIKRWKGKGVLFQCDTDTPRDVLLFIL